MNSKETEGILVAVYGTLRKGWGNHRLLDNEYCTYLGTTRTEPSYKMVSLGAFPGVIEGGDKSITIEVYSVNSKKVEQQLDWLEGFPSFYQKAQLMTEWGTATMYVLSEEHYGSRTIITDGDWSEYIKELRSRTTNKN